MLAAAEKIGLALGLSSFIVGVVIVGLGTSFPEVISSFAAILQGAPEIVAANVIGSNIANILLVVGLSAVVGGRLAVTKNLIDLDLPLLAISSALFLEIVCL
jgi:cation:H+ antiporter